MNTVFKTLILCLLAGQLLAQKQTAPSIQDIQREMLEMQRQFLQNFQQMTPGEGTIDLPDWRWDTTFSWQITPQDGETKDGRFFFSPFEGDSIRQDDFWRSNPFMDGFKSFGDGFQWTFPPNFDQSQNDENSALDDPGDGLLPEERLRKEAEQAEKPENKPDTPASKKSKIKTIRI